MNLFEIPENFSDLDEAALRAFIDGATETARNVGANPDEFTSETFSREDLMNAMTEGVAAIEQAKAALAALATAEVEQTEDETEEEPEAEEAAAAATDDSFAELATRAQVAADEAAALEIAEPVVETVEEVEVVEEPAAIAASAAKPKAKSTRRMALGRSRRSEPVDVEPAVPVVALTAAAENLGFGLGQPIGETEPEARQALSRMMSKRRAQFGTIPEGTHGEKVPLARADWSDLYPTERKLGQDMGKNLERIEAVTADAVIRASFEERLREPESLTASGGLCAPVTPYYGLQMLSTADRPVRAALAAFNADRGGINAARPAALTAIDDAVGSVTAAEDAAGGSNAVKSCQVIDCPDFEEVDIEAIYHCLQFGNFAARTFPELLAQWTDLTLAAHARFAETGLLDGIRTASTKVTATDQGLGASGALPGQIIAAANGMRSRHRMNDDAVLRLLLPFWVLDLLTSDVYRSQFQRFDMTPEQFVGILRRHNVEPSFYKDSATGRGQVWGAQSAGALLPFPATVEWYLYPEGSFLYLDGGTLELGLVRDSALNSTNDFQIFGETFEAIAFIGVESLAVTSTTCDSGTVSSPETVACPIDYAA